MFSSSKIGLSSFNTTFRSSEPKLSFFFSKYSIGIYQPLSHSVKKLNPIIDELDELFSDKNSTLNENISAFFKINL